MMMNDHALTGKPVVSQDGRDVGAVAGLVLDVDKWSVRYIEVRLSRDSHEDLNLKRPLIRSQVIQVPVQHVSGVSDTVVLSSELEDLAFIGGKPDR